MRYGFACQNPQCPSTKIDRTNNGMNAKNIRMHTSQRDVNRCYGKYLVENGYTRITNREYSHPDRPRLLLDRRGTEVRSGKRPQGGGPGDTYIYPIARIL